MSRGLSVWGMIGLLWWRSDLPWFAGLAWLVVAFVLEDWSRLRLTMDQAIAEKDAKAQPPTQPEPPEEE